MRPALYTIRSLGRRGVRITSVERATPRLANLGALSRYVSRRIVVPDVLSEPAAYAEALVPLAYEHDVLMPIGMHSIEAITNHRPLMESGVGLPLAPWDQIKKADETRTLLAIAAELGIPQPQEFRLADYENLQHLANAVAYPAIVKTGIDAGLPPNERYAVVRSPKSLVATFRRMQTFTPTPIVQEWVDGEGVGFEALYDYNHQVVASFCHRRLREFPLSGGPSTYCESLHHPEIEALGRQLLDHLKWTGLAMVEFKVDKITGVPKLMEINPRPWGSMILPIRAGIDFPWLTFQLARGRNVPRESTFRGEIKLRFLVNDMMAAFHQVRGASSWSGRWRAIAPLFDPRVKEGVLSIGDPLPSIGYLLKAVRRLRGNSGLDLT